MDCKITDISIHCANQLVDTIGTEVAIFDDIKKIPLNSYPSRTDGIVVCLCQAGSFTVDINLSGYEVTANSLLVGFPDQIIQLTSRSDDFEGHFIVVSTDFMEQTFQSFRDFFPILFSLKTNPKVILNPEEAEQLKCYLVAIHTKVVDKHLRFKLEVVRGMIYALFYDLFAMVDKDLDTIRSRSKSRKDVIYEKYMIEVLKHYKSERSVAFYADKLCLTAKHLSSVVKEMSGKTASEWIDRFVILEARTLLKSSDMSIQQIAEQLNFANQSFFGKYFKHHMGISPKEYRRS